MATLTAWRLADALPKRFSPPPQDSDADLLARFVSERSGKPHSTALIRRYAGDGDGSLPPTPGATPRIADDAFSGDVSRAWPKTAGSVSRGTSLPAWLHRVAYLTSLKLAGQLHRRGDCPHGRRTRRSFRRAARNGRQCETNGRAYSTRSFPHLRKSSAARSSSAASKGRRTSKRAGLLGIPVGTVDSRLHTAQGRNSEAG